MILFLATLLGCKHYSSADEACLDSVPGEEQIDDDYSIAFANRATCWRRLQALSPATLDSSVQIGVTYHTEYLTQVGLDDWPVEDYGVGEGYFGADVWERLENGGFDDTLGDYGLWEILWNHLDGQHTGQETVDEMMDQAYWHEIIEQFEWRASAFSQAEAPDGTWFTYGVIVFDFPATEARSYAVWPSDGMIDAPRTGWRGSKGTPLSVVVGSAVANGDYASINPYELEWVEPMKLTGPSGDIPVVWTLPGDAEGGVPRYSIAGYATPWLTAGTKYDLDGTIKWNGGQKKIHSVFTVSDRELGVATTARTTSPPVPQLHVRWSRHQP